jgi:predicted amidophosphoribosyltransferase
VSEYHQQLRAQRRDDGVCIWCSRAAQHGKVLCRSCARKHKRHARARRNDGRCPRCPNEYDGVMWACDDCRARDAERLRARRAAEAAD